MAKSESDQRNRDDQQKAGSPPRPATEPAGGGANSAKTATDPATGAPNPGAPEPNKAE